jgi:hypothetical protein
MDFAIPTSLAGNAFVAQRISGDSWRVGSLEDRGGKKLESPHVDSYEFRVGVFWLRSFGWFFVLGFFAGFGFG